jgi:pyruvate,orthophosphate dikinase
MLETRILQAARLKGRLSVAAAATSAAVSPDEAGAEIERLRELGYLKGESSVRATPEGKAHVARLVAEERESVDQAALADAYEEFDSHNSELKQVVSDWQLRDGAPNDHTDADYDGAVLARLGRLHEEFRPLVERIAAIAPRLAPYVARFDHALEQINAGDHTYVARPIMDSYHTVWFEFHEELIGLLGLSREEEAAAGRAV